jgi:hypothetical protein
MSSIRIKSRLRGINLQSQCLNHSDMKSLQSAINDAITQWRCTPLGIQRKQIDFYNAITELRKHLNGCLDKNDPVGFLALRNSYEILLRLQAYEQYIEFSIDQIKIHNSIGRLKSVPDFTISACYPLLRQYCTKLEKQYLTLSKESIYQQQFYNKHQSLEIEAARSFISKTKDNLVVVVKLLANPNKLSYFLTGKLLVAPRVENPICIMPAKKTLSTLAEGDEGDEDLSSHCRP